MANNTFHEMFPLGEDTTEYRKLTSDFVSTTEFDGEEVLVVDPEGIKILTAEAFGDIAHYRNMAAWRDGLEARMASQRNDAVLFGAGADRLGNTSCLAIGERSSETMVMALDLAGVAVSAGAACSSGKVHESHVLKAMKAGVHAGRAIRISGGWNSGEADFERLAEVLVAL